MLAVAAEQLVGSLAGQGHGHVLARELAQRQESERRQVRERLVQVPGELAQIVRARLVLELELVVLGAEGVGHPPGVRQLRVLSGETDRERLHRLAHVPRHESDDQARVQAAAQHRAQGHVAHQPQADGLVELVEQELGPLLRRERAVGRRSGEVPPALDPHAPVRDHEPLAGLELANVTERRHRARDVAQHQVGGDRVGIQLVADEAAREHALQLGTEHHDVARDGVVERLDAEPVADQDAAALGAVPDGHGEHAAQPLGKRRGRAPRTGAAAPRCRSGCAARGRAPRAPAGASRGCRSRRSGPPRRVPTRWRTAGARPRRR